MGMTAAEKSFRGTVSTATRDRDWPLVTKTFERYGAYLELVGGDVPVEEHVTYIFPNLGEESVESVQDLHHTFFDGPKDKP